MDFPAEPIEVRLLADIVTKRLGIPILYDESINGKKVTVRVPKDVPESALLGVLQSALRLKGLALVDAEQAGWKQIVSTPNLASVARPSQPGQTPEPGSVLSEVFTLDRADPATLVESIRPLLTQPGGNVQAVPGGRAIIVSDYPSVVAKCGALLKALDGRPSSQVQFVQLRTAEATQLVATLGQVLANRDGTAGGAGGVSLIADERANQVLVAAAPGRLPEVLSLIAGLDKGPELTTKVYSLRSLTPERLEKLLGQLGGETGSRKAYQSTIDRQSQSLIVSAPAPLHAQIADLVRQMDVPAPTAQSPVRFYKLKNAKAADVLATISGLLSEAGGSAGGVGSVDGQRSDRSVDAVGSGRVDSRSATGSQLAGGGRTAVGQSTLTNGLLSDAGGRMAASVGGYAGQSVTGSPAAGYDAGVGGGGLGGSGLGVNGLGTSPGGGSSGAFGGGGGITSFRGKDASVAADVNTNSIVVIAPPDVQRLYADLIDRLDQRRPQVQIECTIVTLDTSNNTSLGVDIARAGGFDGSRVITFSSFGVSGVDPLTGRLAPSSGRGGTFALLSPNIADVVLRALASDSRSRLVSAPQLLVNDNGRGRLQSVAQEPYAEILDTAAAQSRTSFGGNSEAGTSISVEPHISEGDYLQLAYSVELSSFTGASREGLPPPSQKNAVDSTVTIPDGHTIVVGGLSVRNQRRSADTIPGVGDIPVLGLLFGTRTRATTDTTLFVFIRPVILRDDKFEDLKHLSAQKASAAGLPSDLPVSKPVIAK